jgi:uncharacterized membrane protein
LRKLSLKSSLSDRFSRDHPQHLPDGRPRHDESYNSDQETAVFILLRLSTRVLMARSPEHVTAMLFAGLLLCSLFVGGIGAAAGNQRPDTRTASAELNDIETETFEADRTVFVITVRETGNATWRFRYEQRLDTETEVGDFEAYADRFNTNETESFRNFRERATALAESGSEETSREMAAESFRREAKIEERPPAGDEFGVIEMSFVWEGFAATDGAEVVAGDVFIGGLYVGPDQQLRFERGPNLQFESTAPAPDTTAAETLADSETITWLGEESFADRQPRVVFVEREQDTAAPTEPDTEPTSPDGSSTNGSSGSIIPIVAVGIVIVLGASAAFIYRAGLFATGTEETEASTASGPSATQASSSETTAQETDVERATEAERAATHQDQGASQPIADEEFISDEERVISLLESQGGRMKQVEIVDRTDWSKSKVSMLLSDMESEGQVSKLRVGRENIVSLAGHEPDAAGSPFDNE